MIEMVESIKKSCEMLNDMEEYSNTLNERLSEYDLKTADLLHLIENERLNSSQCWRVLKELKTIRNERRKVKQDMQISYTFEKHKNKLVNKDNRIMLMTEIFKCQKNLGNNYKYKMYDEDQINSFLR